MKNIPWLPYVAPFAIYMAFLAIETPGNLIWMYPLKVAMVAMTLIVFRSRYDELLTSRRTTERSGASDAFRTYAWAVVIGLAAIAIWIKMDPYYPKFGKVTAFDPSGRWGFIVARVLGAVVIVPLMEELFWRAFLIRWIIDPNFKKVPIGTFSGLSFVVTVGLFGVEHYQWLAGLICGALYNWLYYRRKSVLACVVAHAVSNAVLAGYVLATGDWKFW